MNVTKARDILDDWCKQFQRSPLDIDVIDDKYILVTLMKHAVLHSAELRYLMDRYNEVSVTAYSCYLDVRLYYNN